MDKSLKKCMIGLSSVLLSCVMAYAQGYENSSAKIKSSIGELEFVGGYPTKDTINKAFDQMDLRLLSLTLRELHLCM